MQRQLSLGQMGQQELARCLSCDQELEEKAEALDASETGTTDGVFEREVHVGGGADDMSEEKRIDRLRLMRDGRAILARRSEDNDLYEGYETGGSLVLEGTYRVMMVRGEQRAVRFTWTSRKRDAYGQPYRGKWSLHAGWRAEGEEPAVIHLPDGRAGGGGASGGRTSGWRAVVDGRYRDDLYMGMKIEEGMVISVTYMGGGLVELQVDPDDTFGRVKQLIHDQKGILPERQRFFVFNGRRVQEDDRTLRDLGVQKNDVLRLFLG